MGSTIVLVSILSIGCGDPVPGPEPVAREVFAALTAKPPRGNMESVYQRLSERTRGVLKARADDIRRLNMGVEIEDWDVIGPAELAFGDRVAKVELVEARGDEATVEVTMVSYVAAPAKPKEEQAQSVSVRLLKEEGQWRVDLPLGNSTVR